MLGVDLDEIHSIDPSYSKGVHTIVIAKLGTISSSIGLSRRMKHHIQEWLMKQKRWCRFKPSLCY